MTINYDNPAYRKLKDVSSKRRGMVTGFQNLMGSLRPPEEYYKVCYNEVKSIAGDKKFYYLSQLINKFFDGFYAVGNDPKLLLEDLSDIPDHILQSVRDNQAFLVYNQTDPGTGYIERIYKNLIVGNDIPESQVIIITYSKDYSFLVPEISRKYNRQPCKVILYNHFERLVKIYFTDEFSHNNIDILQGLKSPLYAENPKKLYLNVNHAWRLHRAAFISALKSKGLLDIGYNSFVGLPEFPVNQFYISSNEKSRYDFKISGELPHEKFKKYYDGSDREKKWALTTFYNQQLFKEPLASLILDGMDVYDEFPMFVDNYESSITSTANASRVRTLLPYMRNSYFTIVNETYYGQSIEEQLGNVFCRFLTEKTFKPIACKHPFILVTMPNSLKLLHELGYKTFDGIIDENYDKEEDDTKRLLMIIQEIERWSKMDKNILEYNRKKMIEIVEYNYKIFANKREYVFRLI